MTTGRMPVWYVNLRASSKIWLVSSRVGASTSAAGSALRERPVGW